ncbi:hypothetical protein LTR70_005470 [Exophiala xenobiotica]|uniref:Uncharacterized protein n=1 Tax=Lithohypha guttulata TaxID=1690604 RepID=A0ABR0KDS7_9EURO|nr:hypothetical protein LTR24_003837 [Lithohypha guttulata]KAK5318328.1 hypothetical protein LTR70_005470 [Exophiala xenobiotica]
MFLSNGGQSQSASSRSNFVSITATAGGAAQGLSRTINNLDPTIYYTLGMKYSSTLPGSSGDCPTTMSFNGVALGTKYLGGSSSWGNSGEIYFQPNAATGTFSLSMSCPAGSSTGSSLTVYLDDIVMKPLNTPCTP